MIGVVKAYSTAVGDGPFPVELFDEDGEKLRGSFLVQKLDYSGDFNGERNYTLQLESSGPVTPA